MSKPITTRLRHVSAKKLATIEFWLAQLGVRVQIYASNFVDKRWYVLFVPPDDIDIDIKSVDLED